MAVDSEKFAKHVVSFYQSADELDSYTYSLEGNNRTTLHALNIKTIFSSKLWKLGSRLRRLQPDIIHVHHSFSGLITCLLGAMLTNAKIITTVHSNYNYYNPRQKFMFLLTYMLSDLIVCNSGNTEMSVSTWRKRLFPRVRTKVIYNGVNLGMITETKTSDSRPGKDPDKFLIGSVGRLVPAKDYQTLIRAFAAFHKTVPSSALMLVGDGFLRESLEQLADDMGIKHSVMFCGALSRKEVYERLPSFDLFVMSSRWEGFGNAMVEAMMANVPVVASRIEPLREILGRGNGLFFTAGDSDDLCRKMLYCRHNRRAVKSLTERACRFARARYSLKSSARQYEEIYETLHSSAIGKRVAI